jgi:hypothetical protein
MTVGSHPRWSRAFASLRHEWNEAPWFVVLVIAVVAFVGPGLLWAASTAISELF